MVAFAKPPYVSPEDYLEWERQAEFRNEYHGGVIVAMSGGSLDHSLIIESIIYNLKRRLEGTSCKTVSQGMKFWIETCQRYYYPDVMVYCGQPQLRDGKRDILLNALVVVEVLSPSTERLDKGEKLVCYQECETLADCVLVAQDRPLVEHYARQTDGSWRYVKFARLDDILVLSGIECVITLAEIYADTPFNASEEAAEDMT